jgi:hypothetical protein
VLKKGLVWALMLPLHFLFGIDCLRGSRLLKRLMLPNLSGVKLRLLPLLPFSFTSNLHSRWVITLPKEHSVPQKEQPKKGLG